MDQQKVKHYSKYILKNESGHQNHFPSQPDLHNEKGLIFNSETGYQQTGDLFFKNNGYTKIEGQRQELKQKIQDISEDPSFINISQTPQRILQIRDSPISSLIKKNQMMYEYDRSSDLKDKCNDSQQLFCNGDKHNGIFESESYTLKIKNDILRQNVCEDLPTFDKSRLIDHVQYLDTKNNELQTRGKIMAEMTREDLLKDPKCTQEPPHHFMNSLLNKGFIEGTARDWDANPSPTKAEFMSNDSVNGYSLDQVNQLMDEISQLKKEKKDREYAFRQTESEMNIIKQTLMENQQFLNMLKQDMHSNIQNNLYDMDNQGDQINYDFGAENRLIKKLDIGKVNIQKAIDRYQYLQEVSQELRSE